MVERLRDTQQCCRRDNGEHVSIVLQQTAESSSADFARMRLPLLAHWLDRSRRLALIAGCLRITQYRPLRSAPERRTTAPLTLVVTTVEALTACR